MTNIASRYKMCSTLVIGGFISYYDNYERGLGCAVRQLKAYLKNADQTDYVEQYYDNLGKTHKKHYLDGYKVKDFAFFVTTIFNKNVDVTSKVLETLGFVVDMKKQYNSKNETHIHMVYGRVDVVLAELAKYDDNGVLIKEEDKDLAPKPKRVRKKKEAVEQVIGDIAA